MFCFRAVLLVLLILTSFGCGGGGGGGTAVGIPPLDAVSTGLIAAHSINLTTESKHVLVEEYLATPVPGYSKAEAIRARAGVLVDKAHLNRRIYSLTQALTDLAHGKRVVLRPTHLNRLVQASVADGLADPSFPRFRQRVLQSFSSEFAFPVDSLTRRDSLLNLLIGDPGLTQQIAAVLDGSVAEENAVILAQRLLDLFSQDTLQAQIAFQDDRSQSNLTNLLETTAVVRSARAIIEVMRSHFAQEVTSLWLDDAWDFVTDAADVVVDAGSTVVDAVSGEYIDDILGVFDDSWEYLETTASNLADLIAGTGEGFDSGDVFVVQSILLTVSDLLAGVRDEMRAGFADLEARIDRLGDKLDAYYDQIATGLQAVAKALDIGLDQVREELVKIREGTDDARLYLQEIYAAVAEYAAEERQRDAEEALLAFSTNVRSVLDVKNSQARETLLKMVDPARILPYAGPFVYVQGNLQLSELPAHLQSPVLDVDPTISGAGFAGNVSAIAGALELASLVPESVLNAQALYFFLGGLLDVMESRPNLLSIAERRAILEELRTSLDTYLSWYLSSVSLLLSDPQNGSVSKIASRAQTADSGWLDFIEQYRRYHDTQFDKDPKGRLLQWAAEAGKYWDPSYKGVRLTVANQDSAAFETKAEADSKAQMLYQFAGGYYGASDSGWDFLVTALASGVFRAKYLGTDSVKGEGYELKFELDVPFVDQNRPPYIDRDDDLLCNVWIRLKQTSWHPIVALEGSGYPHFSALYKDAELIASSYLNDLRTYVADGLDGSAVSGTIFEMLGAVAATRSLLEDLLAMTDNREFRAETHSLLDRSLFFAENFMSLESAGATSWTEWQAVAIDGLRQFVLRPGSAEFVDELFHPIKAQGDSIAERFERLRRFLFRGTEQVDLVLLDNLRSAMDGLK